MADRTSLPSAMEVKSFRLVLSDSQIEDGQKVKTFSLDKAGVDAMSFQSIVVRLKENLGFAELIAQRNISMDALQAGTDGLALIGTDGSRHVPIRTDEQLVTFFKSIRNTKLPTLEVKLPQPGGAYKAAAREAPGLSKTAKDRVEELEDMNFKVSKTTQKLQRSVEELERSAASDREVAQRLVSTANKELGAKIDSNHQTLSADAKKLSDVADGVMADNAELRKALQALEKKNQEMQEAFMRQLDEMNLGVDRKLEDVQSEIDSLKKSNVQLSAESARLGTELQKQTAELSRIEKGSSSDWKAAEDALRKRFTDETSELRKRSQATDDELNNFKVKLRADLDEMSKKVNGDLNSTVDRLNAATKKLEDDVQKGISSIAGTLETTKGELRDTVKTDISGLSTSIDKRLAESQASMKKFEKDVAGSVEVVSKRTEAQFVAFDDRMDNLVKAERSRLGNIERDVSESSAKLRSDCVAVVERVRVDYEQEAARLDADMSDLHMRQDVIKQEINFFQSRLLEQRDWAQRQLSETATATRAAQVDAQEGVAAATKMAHALRDDQVGFRDKMAKHISLLQHASDSYGEAINSLETQRSRMRLELDAILADHKAYVTDMDGWADDVRVKVERLFRAMEPPRLVWSICGAFAKIKDLKKPLAIRSPAFALQGLREVQVEFFPHGTNQSPDGKAVVRINMPPRANVRYQCWLGRLTEGSREYESVGSMAVDLLFDSWKDQILEDGCLPFTMEILQDHSNNDDSLARSVNIES